MAQEIEQAHPQPPLVDRLEDQRLVTTLVSNGQAPEFNVGNIKVHGRGTAYDRGYVRMEVPPGKYSKGPLGEEYTYRGENGSEVRGGDNQVVTQEQRKVMQGRIDRANQTITRANELRDALAQVNSGPEVVSDRDQTPKVLSQAQLLDAALKNIPAEARTSPHRTRYPRGSGKERYTY